MAENPSWACDDFLCIAGQIISSLTGMTGFQASGDAMKNGRKTARFCLFPVFSKDSATCSYTAGISDEKQENNHEAVSTYSLAAGDGSPRGPGDQQHIFRGRPP